MRLSNRSLFLFLFSLFLGSLVYTVGWRFASAFALGVFCIRLWDTYALRRIVRNRDNQEWKERVRRLHAESH